MISTLMPGLASSKVLTIDFSVSVRSGLVITSTSLSVGVGAARLRRHQGGRGGGKKQFSDHGLPFGFLLTWLRGPTGTSAPSCMPHHVIDRGCIDGLGDVGPEGLGPLEADMEAHHALRARRNRAQSWVRRSAPRVTIAGTTRLSWPPQLTPSLKRSRLSQKRAMSTPSPNSKENRPEVPCRPVGSGPPRPGWWTRVTAGCSASRRAMASAGRLVRLHARRQRAQAAQQQPGVEGRELAAEIGADRPPDHVDEMRRPGDDAGHRHRCGRRYISRPSGRRGRRRASAGCWKIGVAQLLSIMLTTPCRGAQAAQARQVLRLHHPARRALEIEQLRARQGRLDRGEVAAVDIVDRRRPSASAASRRGGRRRDRRGARRRCGRPARRRPSTAAEIAAMPLAKPMASSAPSSAAIFSSNRRDRRVVDARIDRSGCARRDRSRPSRRTLAKVKSEVWTIGGTTASNALASSWATIRLARSLGSSSLPGRIASFIATCP